MPKTTKSPEPGNIARVRQRTYMVEEVVKPKRVADSTLVRMSCVDDDNQGAPLEVLWEKELYAVYQGQKVFESLPRSMDSSPDLQVEFYLSISRGDGDTTKSEILVSRFIERFKSHQWPAGSRLPTVFYDPHSISDDAPVRSSLHAKCIVVDDADLFVSSANFTEAGQERNIEVGLRLNSTRLARKLVEHFRKMAEVGLFRRAI